MSDERALLAAIAANPAEDTPRLMLADLYQEHGRELEAELIRIRVAIARAEQAEPKGHDPVWVLGYRLGLHKEHAALCRILDLGECPCLLCVRKRASLIEEQLRQGEERNPIARDARPSV